jgi:hypothetical protein
MPSRRALAIVATALWAYACTHAHTPTSEWGWPPVPFGYPYHTSGRLGQESFEYLPHFAPHWYLFDSALGSDTYSCEDAAHRPSRPKASFQAALICAEDTAKDFVR